MSPFVSITCLILLLAWSFLMKAARGAGHAQARKLQEAHPTTRPEACATAPSWPPCSNHSMRREELCGLGVRYMYSRQGVRHFLVNAKCRKILFVPFLPMATPDGGTWRSRPC
jgi:hypothetical protein